MMNRTICLVVAGVCALSIVLLPGSSVARGRQGWKNCGRSSATYLFVYAKNLGCKKARRISKVAGEQLQDCISSGCRAEGFDCSAKSGAVEGGDIVCRQGERAVKFGYGG